MTGLGGLYFVPQPAAAAAELAAEMRWWCEDVYGDMPSDASDAEVRAAVDRCYAGGVAQFIEDGAAR